MRALRVWQKLTTLVIGVVLLPSIREARVAHAVSALPLTTEKKAKPSLGLDLCLM